MFKAPKGYSFVLCDLSAAEVRTCASTCRDEHMLKAYQEGQDLYSLIASKVYNNNYEDNLEFYPEGTKVTFEGKEVICGKKEIVNKLGKMRRQDSKSVLIGLIYGRGPDSIKEQINESRIKINQPLITRQDAQNLVDNIYKSFPGLEKWMKSTCDFIHKNGYIDDCFGRRRRLPDGMLPRYSFEYIPSATNTNFNPILECKDSVNDSLIKKYSDRLNNARSFNERENIKNEALKEGLTIHDNGGRISQAERRAINFQCQAASSEINKLSMITIAKNKRLKELGFQLLLTIHDEVIGQCPSENAKEVAQIIPDIMTHVGGDKMICPLVADSSIERHWYENDMIAALNAEYSKHTKDEGMSEDEALKEIVSNHTELLQEQIYGCLKGGKNYLWG